MSGLNLWAAWAAIALGVFSGMAQGLFIHDDQWLGGYASWRRRMLRLGHISFFGIAFLNLAFAVTARLAGGADFAPIAGTLLVVAAVSMPAACYLAAWHRALRLLFPIPVVSVLAAVALVLFAGGQS